MLGQALFHVGSLRYYNIVVCSLVPRPLPGFILQPWRKIGRKPGTITMSRTRNGGLRARAEQLRQVTNSLAICFSILEDSGPSAETCLDTKRRACPQPADFFSRRTRIMPSTYVYTSFVSDLVLAKSVAAGKTPRQTLLFDRLLCWPHIAWARCHHYEIESTLCKNGVHYFRSMT